MSRGVGGLSAVISEVSHAAIVTLAPLTMTTGIMFIFAGLYRRVARIRSKFMDGGSPGGK